MTKSTSNDFSNNLPKKIRSEKPSKKSELRVVTKAKDLCTYILTVTEKSPKKFRFTIVTKLQNLSLDLIENIYEANEIYFKDADAQTIQKRINKQRSALTKVKLIAYISQLARELGCILPKQYENISELVHDCQSLLAAWLKSSKTNLEKEE